MNSCVVGIDGGGTKTALLASDLQTGETRYGISGPGNIAASPVEEVLENVRTAYATAELPQFHVSAVCAGIAGFSYRDRRSVYRDGLAAIFPDAAIEVVPDYVIAYSAAVVSGPGMVVIAGTGSACYGEDGHGRSHMSGAYGYLIDDSGSGYGVGRSGIALILRGLDKTGEPTLLAELVHQRFALSERDDFIAAVYGGKMTRLQIASAAELVVEAARNGDEACRGVLRRAGGALARLAESVAVQLSLTQVQFQIARVGSLWLKSAELDDVFVRSAARFAPDAVVIDPVVDPVAGAVARATRLLH